MIRYVTSIIMLLLIVNLHTTVTEASDHSSFSDVDEDQRFYEYITDLVNREVISGFTDGTFRPDAPVKRNEAAIMIGRYTEQDKAFESSSFSDINQHVTGAGYIESSFNAGIISGYPDGTFRPQMNITRAEIAIILDRTFTMEQGELPFDDVDESMQSFDAIQALYGSGITRGFPDNTYRPDQIISRGEFAAFMEKAIRWKETAEERKYEEMIVEVERLIDELPEEIETGDGKKIEKIRTRLNEIQLYDLTVDSALKNKFIEIENEYKLQIQAITEDILGQLDSDYESERFFRKTMDYRALFSMNQNQGNTDAENETVFVEGKKDQTILVTVPHSVEHIRNDEVKLAEVYTGPMGLLLNEYTGVHVLYQSKTGRDPNFYNDVEFKERLAEIIEEYDISLVIDIHGMRNNEDLDISLDIGTNRGRIVSSEWVDSLTFFYSSNDYNNVWENKLFSASNPANIAHYSFHELNVPAMQLEYARFMRNPRDQQDEFYKNIRSLSEFILHYQYRNQ